MPAKTKIEWADYISNPIKATYDGKQGHACVKLTEGCAHCWASTFNVRLGTGLEYTLPNMEKAELFLDDQELVRTLTFKPRGPFKNGRSRPLVFPFDMTDVFGSWINPYWIERCFSIFAARTDVDFLILTKRAERMEEYLNKTLSVLRSDNIYLGTSVENEQRSEQRYKPMRNLSRMGWKTVVSYEPALGPVNWSNWDFINGLICGGESGPKARPMATEWARQAAYFCQTYGIPFFFKQWGEFAPIDQLTWLTDQTTFAHRPIEIHGEKMVRVGKGMAGHLLDGQERREMPE